MSTTYYIWKQLGFKQERDELHLTGELNEKEVLLTELRKFIRQVFIMNPATNLDLQAINPMRVISGIYKRRRFDVPRLLKARPTTDFAKENLFNVLSNYMDFEEGISALDLFAGTGSISIELVSRGCDQVISVEKDRDHYASSAKLCRN